MSDAWPPFSVDGAAVDLSHLAPISLTCPITPAVPGVPPALEIGVRYSSHCFTDHFVDGSSEPDLLWMDHKQRRVFCRQRYRWSLNLPAIMQNLPNAKVQQTHERRNYVRFETIDPAQPQYGVFFTLRRRQVDGCHLSLFVESAYCDPNPNPTAGQVRFKVLAAKVFRNEQVNFKGRR